MTSSIASRITENENVSFDELIQAYPTVVTDGIPSVFRAAEHVDPIIISREPNKQYQFKLLKSDANTSPIFYLHVAEKQISDNTIRRTAIYHVIDETYLDDIIKELTQCKENNFNLIINQILNKKLAPVDAPFNRETAEREIRQKMKDYDTKMAAEAKDIFDNKIGLTEAIQSNILPALVSLRTKNGVVGVGFFQHSNWLVSNAHIIPSKEILEAGIESIDHLNATDLTIEESYHRPDREGVPDVVIIKVGKRASTRCLLTQFSEDEDSGQKYIFYIDFNGTGNSNLIKFLRLRSAPNVYPLVYECEDGSIPEPGCSGTPIIEARTNRPHSNMAI